METKGVIMFNRGDRMLVRALVAVHSLRKFYTGNITFYVQNPCSCMEEFIKSLEILGCNVVKLEDKNEYKTLVMKNSLFENLPYDYTLWIDSDTVTVNKIDKMFEYLEENNADICLTHFCGWVSTGPSISKRINRFKGLAEERHLAEALKENPAINTGILSFKKSDKLTEFLKYQTNLSNLGSKKGIFIPDETSMQLLYPSIKEWGLKCFIAPPEYNVSPIHDHEKSKNPVVYHFHGDKHVLDEKSCEIWKKEFKEMCESNIANINYFLKYADKRLKAYLNKGEVKNDLPPYQTSDVTIVSACDPFYVEELKYTFENWRKYKKIDNHPVIIFYNGMEESDTRLDFLRLPNVTLIPWNENCMGKVDSHRELMLSCFVLGTAKHVKTDYWIKIDADSYATNDHPLYDEDFKNYAFVGPRWGYSKTDLIVKLDSWASTHWKRKLRTATPMINEGKIEGSRFYHNVKRTISFVQFHKTRFSRFCVKLLREDRLPAPSHDSLYFYIIQRFDPHLMLTKNFKRDYGFTQGRGKLGPEHIRQCVEAVDRANAEKVNIPIIVKNSSNSSEENNND